MTAKDLTQNYMFCGIGWKRRRPHFRRSVMAKSMQLSSMAIKFTRSKC